MTRSQPSLATSSAWTPRRRVATRASTPSASSVAASTTVVVTGGASGVGYRLAREFVERGARVFVASRDGDRAMRAAESLGEDVVGVRCDVSVADDVEALMERVVRDETTTTTTTTTHWVNAAGAVTKNAPLCDVDADEIVSVVGSNLTGPLLCGRAVMREAKKRGKSARFVVWNFGFSAFGAKLSKTAATHKSTKSGLSELTNALNADVERLKRDGVELRCEFHQLSPGLALTPLLLGNDNANPISKKIFNALAEEPDVIARALAEGMCDAPEGSTTPVEYLTPFDAIRRMARELPNIATSAGGRHFDSKGERVRRSPDARYDADGVELLPFE